MKVVAISGWKRSGKDTMASYLIEKYGAIRVSFADPLKDMVAEEYGIDRGSLDDPKRKESPIMTMQVDPKDAYADMISEFLIKEFRNKDGLQPDGFCWLDGGFTGTFENIGLDSKPSNGRLYDFVFWTPRALAILKGSTNRSVRSDYWVNKAIEKIANTNGTVVISDLRYKSEVTQLREAFGDDLLTIRIDRFDSSPSKDPSERDLDDAKFDYHIDNRGSLEETFVQLKAIMLEKMDNK